MTTFEIIRDEAGEPLASVCLKAPLTDEERATLVEYFTWLRDNRPAVAQRLAEGGET